MNKIEKCINELLDEIWYSQMDNLRKAKEMISSARNNGHRIFFFGQGHSVWVGRDVENGRDIMVMEEKTGIKELCDYYGVHKDDVIVIVSNSGINADIVEMAIYLKERGNILIAINSNKHTMYTKSRHLSGKKLYQFADVAIDNCLRFGDVYFNEDKDELASLSSIINNVIAHSIVGEK